MADELLALPRHGIEDQRMRRAEDQEMTNDMPSDVEREGLAALSWLKAADVVRREVVQKCRAVVAGQLDLRAVVKIDHPDAGREGSIFGSEVSGHKEIGFS
jgi:hypothetical protein